MIEEYIDWLKSLVSDPGLFTDLFIQAAWDTEFVPIVDNDDNRVRDGLELRSVYSEMALNGPRIAYTRFCTILELLIGISKRMNGMLYIPEYQDLTGYYFSELLENLGIYKIDDLELSDEARYAMYKSVFERLNFRRYEPDGSGGLFPLDRPNDDQRNVEIWYQLQAYLEDRI